MFKTLSVAAASPLRLKVLSYIARTAPEESDAGIIAKVLMASKGRIAREVTALVRTGLISARMVKRIPHYSLNPAHELSEHLPEFLAIIANPGKQDIARAFAGTRGVILVVACGALARDTRSGVDLLVVSKRPADRGIARSVHKVEAMAAYPVRYAVLSAEEYFERRQVYDRLLRDIFDYRHMIALQKDFR
jgi:hypothetical protein